MEEIKKLEKKALDELLTQLKVIHSTENKTQRDVLVQDLHNKIDPKNSNCLSYVAAIQAYNLCREISADISNCDFKFIYEKFIEYANIYGQIKGNQKADVAKMLDKRIRSYIR